MKENRIYLDGRLINICYNEFALMNNFTSYVNKYGKDRITLKRLDETVMDKEKKEWLDSL
ncbi:hypothetical protein [Clostridium rectalis]|uniref:hypothetical protein n=1 Tax=Clostridium rectalis TaxID=2040295 RepID=UPI000F63E989|nr:hypothetical protein [Clostridium rectalis]